MRDFERHPTRDETYIMGPVGMWPFKYRVKAQYQEKNSTRNIEQGWRIALEKSTTDRWKVIMSGKLLDEPTETRDHREAAQDQS